MKFSALNPMLGSSIHTKPDAPVWQLAFKCPHCGIGTSIEVSGRPAQGFIWQIAPDPLALQDMIESGSDILAQWNNLWDHVTIQPSVRDAPHPRQSTCRSHFSIANGNVTLNC